MHRRSFLGQTAAAATAVLQSNDLLQAKTAAAKVSDSLADSLARDENFWFNIRHAFTVDHNIINLNNGGVSRAPKIVMDTEIRYLEMENLNRPNT